MSAKSSSKQVKALTISVQSDGGEHVYEGSATFDANLIIPSEIGGRPVTAIGESAFEDATWLESVSVPASVKAIGDRAFYGCSKLRSADLAEGVESIGSSAFVGSGIESVRVPSTASVGYWAFYGCASLRSVELPEGVRSIGNQAFSSTGIESVSIPSTAVVHPAAFYECSSLSTAALAEGAAPYKDEGDDWDDDYYYYGTGIFARCGSLTSVAIPSSFGAVPPYTFYECGALTSATLGGGLTYIGDEAFCGCEHLSSFALPDGLTAIGYGAFSGCAPAATVVLPASLSSIGGSAFSWSVRYEWVDGYYDEDDNWVRGHDELVGPASYEIAPATWDQYWRLQGNSRYINTETTSVSAPKGMKQDTLVFEWVINPDGTITITKCTTKAANITIPPTIEGRTVTAIGAQAFKGETSLKTVVMPQTLTSVGEGAFAGCTSLQQVLVPQSVTEIDDTAFDGCASASFVCQPGTKAAEFAEAKGIPASETVPLSLASADCEREIAYRPGAIEPEIIVSVGENQLVAGRDYTVSYANNEKLGQAMATITAVEGSGYSGTQYCAFSIIAADIANADVAVESAGAYTGEEARPKATVKLGELALEEGRDFDLSYGDNVNAGEATLTVTGKGNYTGTASSKFTIAPASIGIATVEGLKAAAFNGTPQVQSPTVKLGSKTLKAGTDYEASYKDNVNAGTATVTVTGKGNYSGSRSATFKINAASLASASISGLSDKTYDGKAQTPTPTVKLGGRTLKAGSDYTVSYKDNVNAGTATVTVTGKGNYSGSRSATFKISSAAPKPAAKTSLSKATVTGLKSKAFTGKKITQKPVVKVGGKTLKAGADYTVSYRNNVKVGTATVTVTGKGRYTGAKSATFKIVKAKNPAKIAAKAKSVKFASVKKKTQVVAPLAVAKAQGKVTYAKVAKGSSKLLTVSKKTGKVTVKKGAKKGTYTVKVKVKVAGNKGYKPLTKTVTVKLKVK